MEWHYYLHTNGALIGKKFRPDPSDFVKHIWSIDTDNRGDAWKVVLEALALGADTEMVRELVEKWGLDLEDSIAMLRRVENPTELMMQGLGVFITTFLKMSASEFWSKVLGQEGMPEAKSDEGYPKEPPCIECGAMTQEEAEKKCICGGDKDHCHGCELWP